MKNAVRIFICLIFLFNLNSSFAYFEYPITVFSEENVGIEHNVSSVIQDKKGFLWVCTNNGLCRYDGNVFNIYLNDPLNKKTIASNRVITIQEENKDYLWVSLEKKGISRYNYSTDNFDNFSIIEKNKNQAITNDISYFLLTKEADIWAVTNEFIYRLKKPDNTNSENLIIKQSFPINIPLKLQSRNFKIVDLHQGRLLVGTPYGLLVLNNNGNEYEIREENTFKNIVIKTIYADSNNSVWIITNDGFYLTKDGYHFQKLSFQLPFNNLDVILTQDRNRNFILNLGNKLFQWKNDNFEGFKELLITSDSFFYNNSLFSLYVDQSNTLWMGSRNRGLGKIDLEAKLFNTLTVVEPSTKSKLEDIVLHIMVDSNHFLWISTKSSGLIVRDLNKNTPCYYFRNQSKALQSRLIYSTFEDSKKRIWICGHQGLYLVEGNPFIGNMKINCISEQKNYPEDMKTIIFSVVEDEFHRFWVTTSNGYIIIDEKGDKMDFNVHRQTKQSLKAYLDPYFKQIHLYSWSNGLKTIKITNKDNNSNFINYDKNESNSLANSHIWCVFRSSDSLLWFGTDCGLYSIAPNSSKINRVAQIGEFKSPRIQSIKEDFQKNLWLNTTAGLIYWNRKLNTSRKYDISDGYIQNSLNEAACIDKNGLIYVAGINDIKYFDPQKIKTNRFLPNVLITQLSISNKPVQVGDTINGRVLLSKALFLTEKIKFKYYENNLTLEFANLQFNNPAKNKCAYKLDGYDKEWITTKPNQRYATYNSLPSGTYTFYVKASNNDGIWNENPTSIKIIIGSAPWNTIWAYLIYLSIVLWLIYRYYLYVQLKRNLLIEHLEREKESQINEGKMQFFIELTHELRTPLTLIVSPIQELLADTTLNEFVVKRLQTVRKSSERLLRLVNKYLDLSKIDKNEYPFVIRKRNLMADLIEIKKTFEIHAIQNKINYQLQSDFENIDAWYDKEKIEIILTNLLSNAFKFTPEGGDIYIFVEMQDEYKICISVRDSGMGIDLNELDKIFTPFYQVGDISTVGTGVGLTLSKKLIELHQGEIIATSKKGTGAQFSIIFPINRSAYPASEIIDEEQITQEEIDIEKEVDKLSILIVEDNKDVQDYLRMILEPFYTVWHADNGVEGKKMALQYIPDLILMDITMPKLNGIELTNILKKDIRTTHIPIIIITGNDGHLLQKEGYEKGIHDWIQKPFVSSILLLKISNILKSREMLTKNEIKTKIEHQQDEGEKQFLLLLISIVEKNIDNAYFGVDQLADNVKMTRMQLHRKLLATTGKSASDLIKGIRLNKAKELITTGKYNISEVYYHVGFSSHSYFTKVFKEYFGILPSEIKW